MSNYDELLSQITGAGKGGNKSKNDARAEAEPKKSGSNRKKNIGDDANNESKEKYTSTMDFEGIDYYAVLGVTSDADPMTIKRAYHKRLRKYHPDHNDNKNATKDEMKKNKEKYRLIQEAYTVLNDEFKRKAYDTGKTFEKTRAKDFKSQKDSFDEFIKLQEQNMNDEDKKLSQLKFDSSKRELNLKHGYVDSDEKTKAIDRADYDRKVDDMIQQRAQEDLDIPENMFQGRDFNPREFHKAFEKKKKRDEKRGKTRNGEVVRVEGDDGIMAFNDGLDAQFASVNALDNSDLYGSGKYDGAGDNYAGIGSGMIGNDVGSDSGEISIDSDDIKDNYADAAMTKAEMDRKLQEAMAERSTYDTKIENNEIEYKSAIDDKYGISNAFGFMVGDNKFGHQVGREKNKRSKSNIKAEYEAYKELTEK